MSALNDAYKSMNSPSKLNGWSSSGGDPCGDSWDGITCKGSSVTEMFVHFLSHLLNGFHFIAGSDFFFFFYVLCFSRKVSGRGLSGSLGYQLGNLKSLTYL